MSTDANFGDTTALGRSLPGGDISRTARVVRAIVAVAGLAILVVLLFTHPPVVALESLALFAAAMLICDTFFSVPVGGGARYTVSSTFLLSAFLIGGGVAAAALATVVQLLTWGMRKIRGEEDRTPFFVAFETGQTSLAVLGGAMGVQLLIERPVLTFPVFVNPIATLVGFAVCYFLVSTIISSIYVATRLGMEEVTQQLWPNTTLWIALSLVTNIPIAIILKLIAPSVGYFVATLVVFAFVAGFGHIARLNVRMREANTELRGLNRIGTRINQWLSISDILRVLAEESRATFRWDAFSVALLVEDPEEILLISLSRDGKEMGQRRLARRGGAIARAIESGEAAVENRARERLVMGEEEALLRWRSRILVPMKVGDQAIGALVLQTFRQDAFARGKVELLKTVASQVATAIRNAQLYEGQQRSNLEREEFLSLVTHEIKNPLTSVTGYAELAEDAISRSDSAASLEAVEVIRNESKKILRLTEDLLDASRASAGKFSMNPEENIDLAAIVTEVAGKYQRTAEQDIEVRLPPSFPPISGDPVRLAQVIENLVSNAVKYSSREGRVVISLAAEGDEAVLSVADSGIGIPEGKLEKVFDRFYRVEEDGRAVKGTGLGLFITREIVRAHGGTITVSSTPGVGSVFMVRLKFQTRP